MINSEETLEMMDELLDKAMQVPFSGKKSLIDVEKMRDLIKEIRLNMPTEITQAKNLVNDRKKIISDAKTEAETIIRKAEEKAKVLVSEQEITRQSQTKANEIMITAQQKSKELRTTTNEYVENMLAQIDDLMTKDLTDIKKARGALKGAKR